MTNCYACGEKIIPARQAKFLLPPWDERDRQGPQSPVPFCQGCYDASEREGNDGHIDADPSRSVPGLQPG